MAGVNALISRHNRFLTPHRLYQLFKYAIYLLLIWNFWLWFQEDLAASAETFKGGIDWRNVVEAFPATFDTGGWIALLLLFELETAIIPDDKLRGSLKWILMAIRTLCYVFIVYSLWGYVVKLGMISQVEPFAIADLCSLVGSNWNYLYLLDEYPPLDAAACAAMKGQELFRVTGTDIIASAEQLNGAIGLAWIDIINAGTWLIVVVLLEVEVWLQIKGLLTDRMLAVGKWVKGFFYAVLLFCAIYWGFEGDFLDFWDAFLWLVAFIFIEMNIFQWHEETEEHALAEAELTGAR
jgi:hypothetical protein